MTTRVLERSGTAPPAKMAQNVPSWRYDPRKQSLEFVTHGVVYLPSTTTGTHGLILAKNSGNFPIETNVDLKCMLDASTAVKPAVREQHIKRLVDRIAEFTNLFEDWDGHGGHKPPLQAISDTVEFIKMLPSVCNLPRAGVSGDGEIGLFWDEEGTFIDVGFLGDHKYSFYARMADGQELFGDGKFIKDGLEPRLAGSIPTSN